MPRRKTKKAQSKKTVAHEIPLSPHHAKYQAVYEKAKSINHNGKIKKGVSGLSASGIKLDNGDFFLIPSSPTSKKDRAKHSGSFGSFGRVVLFSENRPQNSTQYGRKVGVYRKSDAEEDRVREEARLFNLINNNTPVFLFFRKYPSKTIIRKKKKEPLSTDQSKFDLIMEKLPGSNLSEFLQVMCSEALSLENSCRIIDKLTRAIAHMHTLNVIHRDLSLCNLNIFWDDRSQDPVVSILDFGCAKQTPDFKFSEDQSMGTPSFLAPEAGILTAQYDAYLYGKFTDVYATVGIIMQLLLPNTSYLCFLCANEEGRHYFSYNLHGFFEEFIQTYKLNLDSEFVKNFISLLSAMADLDYIKRPDMQRVVTEFSACMRKLPTAVQANPDIFSDTDSIKSLLTEMQIPAKIKLTDKTLGLAPPKSAIPVVQQRRSSDDDDDEEFSGPPTLIIRQGEPAASSYQGRASLFQLIYQDKMGGEILPARRALFVK